MENDYLKEVLGETVYLDGSTLKNARSDARRSQWELARGAKISQSSLSRIERHHQVPVALTNALDLAAALEIPIMELLRSDYRLRLVSAIEPEPIEPVPPQAAGPHFGIGITGRIANVEPSAIDVGGNDTRRTQQLLPLVREAADDLAALLTSKSNAFIELSRVLTQYRAAISESASNTPWGLIWGLGVRLEETAAATERKIVDRIEPEMDDAPLAALQALRTLHAPLILASAEGRELQEQADLLRMTREEQVALRGDAVALSDNLQGSQDVIEAGAAALVAEAADAIGQGRHPERGTVFGITTVKHVAIVLISAAVASAAGPFIGGGLGTAVTMAFWESFKKTAIVNSATTAIGSRIDHLLDSSGMIAKEHFHELAPFRKFVLFNQTHLRNIAASTPQLRWMAAYINYITKSDEDASSPDVVRPSHKP